MTETEPDLESITKLTARELLRLPLASLNRLLRDAMEETRKAKRRENWLRSLCVEKVRNRAWGDE
jgi:hypothetical protein